MIWITWINNSSIVIITIKGDASSATSSCRWLDVLVHLQLQKTMVSGYRYYDLCWFNWSNDFCLLSMTTLEGCLFNKSMKRIAFFDNDQLAHNKNIEIEVAPRPLLWTEVVEPLENIMLIESLTKIRFKGQQLWEWHETSWSLWDVWWWYFYTK